MKKGCQPITIVGDIALIEHARGVIRFDAADIPMICKHRWYVNRNNHGGLYACTSIGRKNVAMHRMLLQPLPTQLVDHANHDGLDNRRSNIRVCTPAQSSANVRRANRTSGFRGVEMRPRGTSWGARICFENKVYLLGSFHSAECAARAYDDAARKLHGDFAVLNFPQHK